AILVMKLKPVDVDDHGVRLQRRGDLIQPCSRLEGAPQRSRSTGGSLAKRRPIFEQPSRNVDPAAAKLKRHNDWSSSRVAQFPDHLVGVCGLNPLKDYSLEEVARCAADPNLRCSSPAPNNPAASGVRGVTITGVKSRSIRPAPVRQEKESAGEIEPSQQRNPGGAFDGCPAC